MYFFARSHSSSDITGISLEARSGQALESFKTREEARAALDEWFDVRPPPVGETLSLDEINAEIQSYRRECAGSPAWPGIDIPG